MHPFDLVAALAEDVETIYQIRRTSLRASIEATFGGWNDRDLHPRFVAGFIPETHTFIVLDGQRVGFIELEEHRAKTRVRTLAILPTLRGRGVGTGVMTSLMSARSVMELRVLKTNAQARRFYERLEFRVVGESDRHWDEMRWERAGEI